MGLLAMLSRKSGGHKAPAATGNRVPHFRGVEVVPGPQCCGAVTAIAGKRFLSNHIPRLPLEPCDSASCCCTYQLYEDRRTDLRRASDVAYDIVGEMRTGENRRMHTSGRRRGDE
jgi:hypothetical protein